MQERLARLAEQHLASERQRMEGHGDGTLAGRGGETKGEEGGKQREPMGCK